MAESGLNNARLCLLKARKAFFLFVGALSAREHKLIKALWFPRYLKLVTQDVGALWNGVTFRISYNQAIPRFLVI